MLDEITRQASVLTEEQQQEVLDYIHTIRDNRTYPRVQKRIDIDVLIEDRVVQSDARDISACGVFVKTNLKADLGKPAKVVFSIPGQKMPFKLNGRVVRTEEGGIAICFTDMTTYVRQSLATMLES